MSDTNNGGPAFPGVDEEGDPYNGMSLRDYFAAKAMQGLLQGAYMDMTYEGEPAALAHEAYRIADAMLNARDKP
jgi:hypothetical protein